MSNKNGKRPADAKEELTRMVAENRQGDAVKYFLTKVMGAPAIVPFILRLTPNWAKMGQPEAIHQPSTSIVKPETKGWS